MGLPRIVECVSNCAVLEASDRYDIASTCFLELDVNHSKALLNALDFSGGFDLSILQDSIDFISD